MTIDHLPSLAARFLLLTIGLTVPAFGWPQASGGGQLPVYPVFQSATHPFSRTKAFTATEDGDWLYSAEGGSMAFINMRDSQGMFTDADMHEPNATKKISVGKHGVNASRMILDTLRGGDLLYLAGGRDGLWVMDSDPDPSIPPNRAWRVDDSGNTNPATQGSRRWCSDVQLTTVEGVDYLVAVFGKKTSSVLRIYRLDDVRAIADPSNAELGNEIAPFAQITLKKHPDAPVPGGDVLGRSIALAVDCTVLGNPGDEKLFAYVAMGPHGLARVRFDPGQGSNFTIGVAWGPVFGDSSHYELGNGLIPNVPKETYQSSVYTDDREFYGPAGTVIDRVEAPAFTDVKVYRGELLVEGELKDVYQVYATVDHLNWVMFDLDPGTGAGWSSTMPIAHHEGHPEGFTNTGLFDAGIKRAMLVIKDSHREILGYANTIEFLDRGPDPGTGPYLLVGTSNLPFVKNYLEFKHEPPTFGVDLPQGATWDDHTPVGMSRTTSVFVYEVKESYAPPPASGVPGISPNILTWSWPSGGNLLYAPPIQGMSQKLALFHNFSSGAVTTPLSTVPALDGVCLSLIDISPSSAYAGSDPPVIVPFLRSPEEGHIDGGYIAFHARPTLADPRLILTGTNDDPQRRSSWLRVDPLDTSTGLREIVALPLDEVVTPIVEEDFKIHAGPNSLLVPEDGQWISFSAKRPGDICPRIECCVFGPGTVDAHGPSGS